MLNDLTEHRGSNPSSSLPQPPSPAVIAIDTQPPPPENTIDLLDEILAELLDS